MKERVGKGLFHQAGNLRSPIALCGAVAAYSNGTLVVSNRYDHLGRRVQKIAADGTHTFLYDGWRPVVETVAKPGGATDRIEYHWGKDLSGTLDGAAGVGGLLYVKRNGEIYVPFYDAYGNVMGYWDEQGNVVAEYAYDAFGRTVAKNGTMADVFSIRYSTKYYDAETGMYYYGRRFCLLALCRWLTRDPIEEQGGVNLYAFCANSAICRIDPLGAFSFNLMWRMPTAEEQVKINSAVQSVVAKSDYFLSAIARFKQVDFPQSRGMANPLFSNREWTIDADLAKLPYKLVEHFALEHHRNRGTLNMALTQIENRLRKERKIGEFRAFRVSTCRNVLCGLGIDALTTPWFIGICQHVLKENNDAEMKVLIGHEASHYFRLFVHDCGYSFAA